MCDTWYFWISVNIYSVNLSFISRESATRHPLNKSFSSCESDSLSENNSALLTTNVSSSSLYPRLCSWSFTLHLWKSERNVTYSFGLWFLSHNMSSNKGKNITCCSLNNSAAFSTWSKKGAGTFWGRGLCRWSPYRAEKPNVLALFMVIAPGFSLCSEVLLLKFLIQRLTLTVSAEQSGPVELWSRQTCRWDGNRAKGQLKTSPASWKSSDLQWFV